MTTLDTVLLLAGLLVTLFVAAGMFLLTPRGTVTVEPERADGQGSELSSATAGREQP